MNFHGLMILGAVAVIVAVLFFLKLKIYYFPACFFLIKFVAGRLINFDRVRDNVVFQLGIVIIMLLAISVRNCGKLRFHEHIFFPMGKSLMVFVVINMTLGVLVGHNWFQIFIDAYKYIEIIVYYVLFVICWKNNDELLEGLKALCNVMLCIGFIEIFITSRGGVGLNLIMGLFPIIILLAMYGYLNHYKVILGISLAVVVLSQTRTYIIAFFLGIILLASLIPANIRRKLTGSILILSVLGVLLVVVLQPELILNVVSRFLELSAGFSESGGYRIDEYRVAIQKFIEHPLIGNGFGYLQYTFINKMGFILWGDFIHCIYIEILFKTGLAGISALIFIVGKFAKKIVVAMRYFKNKNKFMFAICCGGICSFANWLITYTFAPLTTYGSIFIGIITSAIAVSNYWMEHQCENATNSN